MYTFSRIKMAKFDVATLYLILATYSGVRLYLQNCKSENVLVVSIFETEGVMWVQPFTCNIDLFSKFVLLTGQSTRITVKVFHKVDLFLMEENGPESKRESCSAAH